MSAYVELCRELRRTATLAALVEQLSWDQETMMPPAGASFRAEQTALVARLAHQRFTAPRIGELLDACEADETVRDDELARANLREMRRDWERARKLPEDLVAEMNETSSRAMEAWKLARASSDFASFRPWLERQVELNRRKAACWGHPPGGEPYDALVDDFEPGMTGKRIEAIFRPLRAALTPLIAAVAAARRCPDPAPSRIEVPEARQRRLMLAVLERIGFALDAGRLDVSAHPFSIGFGPGDTRITTRYRPDGVLEALGSTLHEAGHGLYEQGLPKAERFGEPLSQPVSLGIHESQSRLWENHVGRSRVFWSWAIGEAGRLLDGEWQHLDAQAVYEAVNTVEPSLIRVEADEATYNLHVMLRFDVERAMIRGDLAPKDLPGAWGERVRGDLGLEVPDDRRGCLQDVHWSMGAFGYFPTYTLGSLYAAQFWEAACEAIPDLGDVIAAGRFEELLGWLRRELHAHGRRYAAEELCRRVTGRPLGHEALLRHLTSKLEPIYGLSLRAWP